MKKIFLLMAVVLGACVARAQQPSAFDKYYANAGQFAKAFPREKVYLHFDNTSYYQGDTIWYKAYVVTDNGNKPSNISRPLYVELVDQLGNVMQRHIVKIANGEGHGQISLSDMFFTGYYEVRAYTKWMLAFDRDPQYFSRTIPVYRKLLNNTENRRAIATYRMDKSMKQRPKETLKALNVRFYPEGGQLVCGLPSTVGFEVMSPDSGWVNLEGSLLSDKGERLMPLAAIHDGMGRFAYTPGDRPATAEFRFNNKTYRFRLPEAAAEGYTLVANTHAESIDVTVSRSSGMTTGEVALFVFSAGNPCTYIPVDFGSANSKRVKIMTASLPDGVVRLSLVSEQGNTLLDRFCFVYPKENVNIAGEADAQLYAPYSRAHCRFKVTAPDGTPVSHARLSVAVRDALNMDYVKDDNSIFTDLLLTSELKGYIHRPGFYFADQSTSRRLMLDNLMLIRGWRKYDVEQSFGMKEFKPLYMPEPNLNLYGHIDSWYGKSQSNIGVTLMAHNDSVSVMGATQADSLGNFVIPIDDFYGTMESLIQTKRDGKKFNRNALVSLYRNFEPPLRNLDYCELNPTWDMPADTTLLNADIASFEAQKNDGEKVLEIGEVVVSAKFKNRRLIKDTEKFERDILGFYNVRQCVDRMRDEGKFVTDDIGYMMHTLNDKINREGTQYGVNKLKYSANGKEISQELLVHCLEMVETAMLYADRTGMYSYKFNDKDFRVDVDDLRDIYTGHVNMDTVSQTNLREMFICCALTMNERWDAGKSYAPTHGIRRTEIMGYSRPAEFYSPMYPENMDDDIIDDRRRTFYWNPDVVTDENGEAVIECSNSRNTTYMNVSAETLCAGRPAALKFNTYSGKDN